MALKFGFISVLRLWVFHAIFTRVQASCSSKPTILIVSGAAHQPTHFEPLQYLLEDAGYGVHNPRLPSNAIIPPDDSYQLDNEVIRKIATQLVDEGKRVIVLMHSYGGFLGTNAVAGLGSRERASKGLRGGIEWLAYMAALIPFRGETPVATESISTSLGEGRPSLFKRQSNADRIVLYENPEDDFYNDLNPDMMAWAVAELTGFSTHPFTAETEREAWREINVAYFKCESDNALFPEVQQAMVDRVKAMNITVDETYSNASHSPYLSQPAAVVSWIKGL